jgi:hypothetical protein
MSKISSALKSLYKNSPYARKYAAGFSFCGITVPIIDVAAMESSSTTVSFTDTKNFHKLLEYFRKHLHMVYAD